MESVEALCENFSLINRSHNILSGNVAEIRSRMGADNYKLTFQGSPEALFTSLGDRVLRHKIGAPAETPQGLTYSAELKLQPGTPMREFISLANEAVDIVTFDRALPSMNEIFIKTVEQSNAAADVAKALRAN